MTSPDMKIGRIRILSPDFIDRLRDEPLHRDELLTDNRGNWWIPRDSEENYR